MSLTRRIFERRCVAVGVVSVAVGLISSACGTSAPSSTVSGAGAQGSGGQSTEAASELTYEGVGACTVVTGANPEYFEVAAPEAIGFYDFLNGRTVEYEQYLDEQLALSDIDGTFALGYQDLVRPGGVEQMSRELCRYAGGSRAVDRAVLEALYFFYHLPESSLTAAAQGRARRTPSTAGGAVWRR